MWLPWNKDGYKDLGGMLIDFEAHFTILSSIIFNNMIPEPTQTPYVNIKFEHHDTDTFLAQHIRELEAAGGFPLPSVGNKE